MKGDCHSAIFINGLWRIREYCTLHLCLTRISTYCPNSSLSLQSVSLHVISSFPIEVWYHNITQAVASDLLHLSNTGSRGSTRPSHRSDFRSQSLLRHEVIQLDGVRPIYDRRVLGSDRLRSEAGCN
jgi:hypothetical protein